MIGDREARQPQLHGLFDQLFRRRGAVEEREIGVAVEFGVGGQGHREAPKEMVIKGVVNTRTNVLSCHRAKSTESLKHRKEVRRLTRMQIRLRPVAFALARSLAMVALAALLILVLLPAALAAQAARTV